MTELNDETIDKIANAIRNKRISKIWQDPKKAQIWGESGWYVAFIAVIISVVIIGVYGIDNNFSEEIITINNDFRNIALKNMDCDALKQTLLDLEADEDEKANWDVQKQIIARCL